MATTNANNFFKNTRMIKTRYSSNGNLAIICVGKYSGEFIGTITVDCEPSYTDVIGILNTDDLSSDIVDMFLEEFCYKIDTFTIKGKEYPVVRFKKDFLNTLEENICDDCKEDYTETIDVADSNRNGVDVSKLYRVVIMEGNIPSYGAWTIYKSNVENETKAYKGLDMKVGYQIFDLTQWENDFCRLEKEMYIVWNTK